MQLVDAFGVRRGEVVSFVGAGGKTSALLRLGHELVQRGFRVLATTTTRIAVDELIHVPSSMAVSPALAEAKAVSQALADHRFVFVYDSIYGPKVNGLSAETVARLIDRVGSDVLLVEADGARRLPFKAPYPHEPVIPEGTTRVIVCAGMDALGQPLNSAHVYNPEAMVHRYGYQWGAPIVWPWMASVLRDGQLGLANVPPAALVYVLLNKTPPDGILRRRARLIAGKLLRSPRIHGVVVGEMTALDAPVYEVRKPIAAVVLAGGKSSRMGRPKTLLPWGKHTVLEAIIRQLIMARMDYILVVTGHEVEGIVQVTSKYDVATVYNPDHASGEMLSSLQVGLQALPARFDGCLVVLGDQPQIESSVIVRILDTYAEGWGDIVIPSYEMRRGHPVLFGRATWGELLSLPAGHMPREVVNARQDRIAYVNVHTDSIVQDIDTPDDYQRALRRAGLA